MSDSIPQFSVIIPAYNAEKTLRRCVDSVLGQTIVDFEAIIINDGSTDGTRKIIEEYAAVDPRIIAIHKPNGGVSSARNVGLDRAAGEYIVFIDADDWVVPNYLFEFSKHSADIIFCWYQSFGFKLDNKFICSDLLKLSKEDIPDFVACNFNELPLRTPWCKCIKREVIESKKIRFRTTMRIGEDTEFLIYCLSQCKDLVYIPIVLYNYFCQENRVKDYKLTAEEYKSNLAYIEKAISSFGSSASLSKAYQAIRVIFEYIFVSGMWHSGMKFARKNAISWFTHGMWRFLPSMSFYKKIKYTIVMALWPILYKKLILENSVQDS